MGWLFACFGYSKKRKRSKTRRIGSYIPLKQVDESDHSSSSTSHIDLRNGCKDEEKSEPRKKVRFNMNVTTYEPIPTYNNDDDDEVTSNLSWSNGENEDDEEEVVDESAYAPLCKVFVVEQRASSATSSYRYSNCYEYDHEDDTEFECSSNDEEDESDGDNLDHNHNSNDGRGGHCDGPQATRDEKTSKQLGFISMAGEIDDTYVRKGGFKSTYMVSVLNPIENLSQLKAIKARKF